jgi:hypothetical protein
MIRGNSQVHRLSIALGGVVHRGQQQLRSKVAWCATYLCTHATHFMPAATISSKYHAQQQVSNTLYRAAM